MPFPIHLNNSPSENENMSMNYSFLLSNPSNNSKKVTASNREADMVMDLWSCSLKNDNGEYFLNEEVISHNDFMKLKYSGFINGDKNNFKFTSRAQSIIKIMSLGENNKFLRNQKSKNYTEIMASMNKKGKKGYRIASKKDKKYISKNLFDASNYIFTSIEDSKEK
jgi:hypothetical protein